MAFLSLLTWVYQLHKEVEDKEGKEEACEKGEVYGGWGEGGDEVGVHYPVLVI